MCFFILINKYHVEKILDIEKKESKRIN